MFGATNGFSVSGLIGGACGESPSGITIGSEAKMLELGYIPKREYESEGWRKWGLTIKKKRQNFDYVTLRQNFWRQIIEKLC